MITDIDNLESIKALDTQGMLARINNLPDQLALAWELGLKQDLPAWEGIQQVVVCGMGGSAIGGDLVAAYVAASCSVPISVHRDYDLPASAKGPETLVICSSHSGNTEETLSAFEAARANGCRVLAMCTGGKLAQAAQQAAVPAFTFEDDFQPRAAVGYSFGLLLAAIFRLGLIPDPSADLKTAVTAMKAQMESIVPQVPATQNLAKRLAGQLVDRWIVIFGADFLGPIARRWKTQINEIAKAPANFEVLPEADHNTLQGSDEPEKLFGATMELFLRSNFNHPRNQLRIEHTKTGMMLQGMNTDYVDGSGENLLAEMWTLLHLGDYVSFYLAVFYSVDPTPVPMLVDLKGKMASAA